MKRFYSGSIYGSANDDFGILKGRKRPTVTWYSCRDGFRNFMRTLRRCNFLFCHDGQHEEIKAFVKKIEQVLKVPRRQRIKFHETNHADVMYLSVGKWWSTPVRRDFLTILLRAGDNYNPKKQNWRKTINDSRYVSGGDWYGPTMGATKWFLAGHTRFNPRKQPRFSGWCNTFGYYSNYKEMLV